MSGARARRPRRLRAVRGLAGESGQALVEQALLLATLLGVLVVGALWLLRTQPGLINAIDVQVRGFYFVLSLPFP
ncbi:MAG: hypothetical protein NVSMB23_01770 [Myxococcales bacterium]